MRKLLLITMIALICTPALSQDRQKPAAPQELKRIIYVPREELMRVIDPTKHGRVIELEEYLRLEKLAAGAKVPEMPPPLEVAFTRARYQGMVDESQAAMSAELRFSTLRAGWMVLDLGLEGAALAYAKLDGRDALINSYPAPSWVRKGQAAQAKIRPMRSGMRILVPEKGDHVLRAMVYVPVRNTPAGRALSALLPATSATYVNLTFPGKVEIVNSSGVTERSYDESADTTKAEMFLGKDRQLVLTYRTEEKRVEMERYIIASTDQHTVFDQAGSRTVARIRVDSHRATIESLKISVNADTQVSDLKATDMLDWAKTVSGTASVLEIRFRKPVRKTTVDLTLNRESTAKERRLPLILVPAAGLNGWMLRVSHTPDVRAEFVSARNVRQVPVMVRSAMPSETHLAFESWTADHDVSFHVSDVAAEVESVITKTIDIRRERILLNANCLLRVLRGRRYRFSVNLPSAWEILHVQVHRGAGFDYTVSKEGGRRIILLASPLGVEAGGGVLFSVQARLVPGGTGGEKWKGLSFDLPRLEIPGTELRGGTVTLSGADYLALAASDMKSLRDMDIAQAGLQGASLAYRILDSDYAALVKAVKKTSRLVAGVTTALSISERMLGVRSLVTLNILESPLDTFRIALPKDTGSLVQFTGQSIKERTLVKEEERDVWKITLQKEIQGAYQLLVTFDRQIEDLSQKITTPNIEILDAYRQDGYVAVEAGEGMEIGAAPGNMEEVYVSEVSALRRVQSPAGTGIFVHAFRYSRPDHSLVLDVKKHELQDVASCIVSEAIYNTIVTEDGLERTECRFGVKSVGQQFFGVKLPEKAVFWSALLGRGPGSLLPVKPLVRGDEILVPLTAASGSGTDYVVKVVYQRPHEPMGAMGSLALDVPLVTGGPVIETAWHTFVPEGYRYYGHSGAVSYDIEETVGETVFDHLFYPVFILAIIAAGIWALVAAVKRMPRFRVSPSVVRYAVATMIIVVILGFLSMLMISGLGTGASEKAMAPPTMVQREYADQEYDETLKRAMFKTPRVEAKKMVEKPVIVTEEEVEITKDIPRGTNFDNLANKNLDSTGSKDAYGVGGGRAGAYGQRWGKGSLARPGGEATEPDVYGRRPTYEAPAKTPEKEQKKANDIIFLQDGQKLEGRLAGRGKGFLRLATLNGMREVPEGEIDSIRHADGRFVTVGTRQRATKQGLLSMAINLRWSGEMGKWSALSGGGAITMDYVSTGAVYFFCFLITFGSMLVFMALERKDLRFKVLYAALLIIIIGSLPAISGPEHYPYCNAAFAGLVLGFIYYQARNFFSAVRANIKPVVISALILTLAVASFCQPSAAWAQEKEKELPPIKATDRIIPYDTKDILRVKGRGSIVLSEAYYRNLLERAGLVKRVSEIIPPEDTCISGAHFQATLLADRLEVKANYSVAVLAKGEKKVELGLGGLAISEALLDGKSATLAVSPGGGYAIVLKGPRRAGLSLAFSLPRDPQKTRGQLSFSVAPVAASILDVRTGADTDIKVLSAIGGQAEIENKEARLVSAVLGPVKKVSLSWSPHRKFDTGLGLRTVVSSELLYRIDRDVALFDGTYNYSVQGGEVSGVRFIIPENLHVYGVSCPKIRLWRLVEETPRVLEVMLQSKPGRSFAVTINGAFMPPGDGSEYPLPVPQCRDVEREAGKVTLALRRMMSLRITEREGLRRTVQSRSAPGGYEIHSAYTYLSHPFSLEVAATPKETDLRAQTSALLVIGTDQTYLKSSTRLESGGQPVYGLYADVPSGFRIEKVSCEGMKSYFTHEGEKSQKLHIVIPGGLPGASTLVIEGVRRTVPDIAKEKIPAISIAGVKRHRGEIAVAAEPGYMINTGELKGISPVGVDKVSVNKAVLGLARVQQAFKYSEENYSGELLVSLLKPKLSATVVTALTVRGEVLSYAAILEYGIENAGCQEFRFRIPSYVRKSLSFQGAYLREKIFSEPDENGMVEVTVKLQHDVLESYSLVLYWEEDPTEGVELAVPVVEPLGVETTRAFVAVQATADLRFIQREGREVEVVDSTDIPYMKNFETQDARVLLAVKALEIPYVVPFALERPKKAAEIEAIIDNAEYTAVVNRSHYSYNRASFHIQNRAKQYLKLRMPKGANLWTADVAGVPVKPARLPEQNGSIVLIPLMKQSEEDISYFVSVYYGLQLKQGSAIEPKLAEPLEIEVVETYVSVYLPERYTYKFDTNMDKVIRSLKEVAKGQTVLAEAERIKEKLKTESDAAALERLAYNFVKLNESLRGQIERAKQAQEQADIDISRDDELQKQYYRNIDKIQTLEAGLTANTAYTRHANKFLEKLRRQQEPLSKFGIDSDKQGEQGRRRGQKGLDQYAQQQQERLQSQMKQRDVAQQQPAITHSITGWTGSGKKEAGFEVQDKPAERDLKEKKSEEKRKPTRPEQVQPKSRTILDLPATEKPVLEPPPPPEDAAPRDYGEMGGAAEMGYFHPARAAGVQPLKIELPERGVSLHFKKLGRNPKLTLYPSSTTARVKWAYALRMLIALALVAFCVWQGISLFGAHGTGRKILEGAAAVVVIALALGSTILALVAAGVIGAYAAAKYQASRQQQRSRFI